MRWKNKAVWPFSCFVSFCYSGIIRENCWRYLNVDKTRDARRSRRRLNTSGNCSSRQSSHGAVDKRKRRRGRPNQHHRLILFYNDAQERGLLLLLLLRNTLPGIPLALSVLLCVSVFVSLNRSLSLTLVRWIAAAVSRCSSAKDCCFCRQCCYQFGSCRCCCWCICCCWWWSWCGRCDARRTSHRCTQSPACLNVATSHCRWDWSTVVTWFSPAVNTYSGIFWRNNALSNGYNAKYMLLVVLRQSKMMSG